MAENTSFDVSSIKRHLDEYEQDSYECESVGNIRKNPVDKKTQELLKHQLEYNLSYKNTESIAEMMNEMPGAEFVVPNTKKKLKSAMTSSQYPTYEYYVFCKCDNLVKDGIKCEKCGTI